MNFPYTSICSNIPAVPTSRVSLSQLIRYTRACGSYQDFLDRGLLLIRKLLNRRDRNCLVTIWEHRGLPPVFGGVCVAHLLCFLCCVICFVCLRPAYPMLSVSLDCPFLIDRSVFSNVYWLTFYAIYMHVSQMTTDMFHLS